MLKVFKFKLDFCLYADCSSLTAVHPASTQCCGTAMTPTWWQCLRSTVMSHSPFLGAGLHDPRQTVHHCSINFHCTSFFLIFICACMIEATPKKSYLNKPWITMIDCADREGCHEVKKSNTSFPRSSGGKLIAFRICLADAPTCM